jgi:nucleotide-binding universal stress UspA family protein
MSLVTIAEYASHVDADLARLKLFGEGIDAHILDGGMASLGLGFMTPARLMVLDEDEDQAKAILSAYAAELEALNRRNNAIDDDDENAPWRSGTPPEGAPS